MPIFSPLDYPPLTPPLILFEQDDSFLKDGMSSQHHEKDIRRRFNSSLKHFFRFYLPLVDEALLCDAEAKPILIAHFKPKNL